MSIRRAFTLLELLLVISLLGLLAVFVWPNFDVAQRGEQLEESARRVRSLVAMCRAEAMSGSRRYRIAFRQDGSLKVWQQSDPIEAPQNYGPVRSDWARLEFLLEDVWVESVTPLPEGPPPVVLQDKLTPAEEEVEVPPEPIAVTALEVPLMLEFRPDGTSASLSWVLRDVRGRGVQMTLDGRLGRVAISPVDSLAGDTAERPARLEEERESQAAEAGQEPQR